MPTINAPFGGPVVKRSWALEQVTLADKLYRSDVRMQRYEKYREKASLYPSKSPLMGLSNAFLSIRINFAGFWGTIVLLISICARFSMNFGMVTLLYSLISA